MRISRRRITISGKYQIFDESEQVQEASETESQCESEEFASDAEGKMLELQTWAKEEGDKPLPKLINNLVYFGKRCEETADLETDEEIEEPEFFEKLDDTDGEER